MQEAVRLIEEWSYSWGFKFSVEKTKMMVFTRKRVKEARILMYGKQIEQVNNFRFLGVIFDSKLNWIEHVRKVEEKCKMILNIMRCLTGSECGASKRALRDVYVALMRPVIEYGSIMYRSASKTSLRKLEVIQNQALRICCGAIRTSPACAVQVEMGELPLNLRFKQLMMNYWANIKGLMKEGTLHYVSKPMLGKYKRKGRMFCLGI